MKRANEPKFAVSTRWLLASTLVSIIVALVAVFAWRDITDQRSNYLAIQEERGVRLAASIAAVMADELYNGDVAQVREVALIFREQEGLRSIEVFGAEGDLIVGADIDRYLTGSVGDPETMAVIAGGRPVSGREGSLVVVTHPVLAGRQLVGGVRLVFDDARFREFSARIYRELAIWAAGFLAVGVAVSLIVASRFTKPVRALAAASTALADGDQDIRVEGSGTSELRELGSAFNAMAEKLDTSRKEVASANAAQTQFFASVSHELRTPLTSAISFADMLSHNKGHNLTKRQLSHLDVIRRNQQQLARLINDVLDIGRMQAGTFKLSRTEFDIKDVVSEIVENFRPMIGAKRQDLRVTLPGGEARVNADRARMVQSLSNILSNASKYSFERTLIKLEATVAGRTVVIQVEDQGIGIPVADLQRLFTPFFRAKNAANSGAPGTGLGLHIARSLILQHGGDVNVTSRLGGGTTVRITLPLAGDEARGNAKAA